MRANTKLSIIAVSLATLFACSPQTETSQTTSIKSSDSSSIEVAAQTQQTAEKVNEQTESARLEQFFADTWELGLKRSPIFQSYLGKKWDYDKWGDISEAFTEESIALATQQLATANQFDESKLNESEKLSLRLFKIGIERDLANDEFRHHTYIMHQFRAFHTMVPSFLINIHRVSDEKDAQDYISRLQGVNPLFDQVIEQLKIRQELGVYPPKWSYEQMIQAAQNVITGAPFDDSGEDSTIYDDFKNKVAKLELGDETKRALVTNAELALVNSVKPAYEKLIAELALQQELTPAGDGVWRLPEGDKWYQNRLNWFTTTDLTAAEVHQIGLDNVARIHTAMRDIMQQVNFDGSLAEFFEFMRNDPQFYLPNTDEGREQYMTMATQAIDTMREKIPEYFGLLPKAPMIVKRVEAFREKSAGKAFYNLPAPDGSRPGIYYANLYDMNSMPTYQLEALAYHEGIPGHHMQLAIAQELEGVPEFQKFLRFTAYTEGWGLYTEELAKDMGFYQDPYSDFGRLAMELWRACRLVVDTGIHAMKWSREEAVEYLIKNTPNPAEDAQKAIERYIAMPGQATAYMIGKLEIMRLREKAMQALGDDFSYADFHDEILKDGPVPLNILEEKIEALIAKSQTKV